MFLYLDYNDVLDTAELDMLPGAPCRRVFNAATEHIRIGPCILHWSQVSNLELGVLCNLHHEIQDRIRMPELPGSESDPLSDSESDPLLSALLILALQRPRRCAPLNSDHLNYMNFGVGPFRHDSGDVAEARINERWIDEVD